MTKGHRQSPLELTIGVVGSHDLVERIMLSPSAAPGPHRVAPGPPGPPGTDLAPAGFPAGPGLARRLVAAAYRSEQEAGDKVLRLGPGIDAWLFASQVPYVYARRAGVLHGPATCVPLGGSALYAALLRGCRDVGYDLARLSVDTLSRAGVDDAFADLGMTSSNVHVREEPGAAAALAAFHERLWRRRSPSLWCSRPAVRSRPPCAPPPCSRRSGALRTPSWRSRWLKCRRSEGRRGGRRPANRERNSGSPCTGCWCRRRSE